MTDLRIDASGQGRREKTADPEPKQRHRWQRLKGSHTLAELLAWADAEGLDYGAVSVPWVTLHWSSPETPEEVAERLAWQERHAARHAEWERETWERLRAKFDSPTPSAFAFNIIPCAHEYDPRSVLPNACIRCGWLALADR